MIHLIFLRHSARAWYCITWVDDQQQQYIHGVCVQSCIHTYIHTYTHAHTHVHIDSSWVCILPGIHWHRCGTEMHAFSEVLFSFAFFLNQWFCLISSRMFLLLCPHWLLLFLPLLASSSSVKPLFRAYPCPVVLDAQVESVCGGQCAQVHYINILPGNQVCNDLTRSECMHFIHHLYCHLCLLYGV